MNARTYMSTPSTTQREWHLVDAKGQVLGDLAVKIAFKLMGKHKPTYTPHIDSGDYVVVINAREVVVTGNKRKEKMYYSHSGFPGGLKLEPFEEVMAKDPTKIIQHAVKGMIPQNKLRTPRLRRMKVFADAEHTYTDKFV